MSLRVRRRLLVASGAGALAAAAIAVTVACGESLDVGPDNQTDAMIDTDANEAVPASDAADAGRDAAPEERARRLSAGATTACAVRPRGKVYCWGGNARGAVGAPPADNERCPNEDGGTLACRATPFEVKGLLTGEEVIEVSTGGDVTCARTRAKAVYCWGSNDHLRLGVPAQQVSPFTHSPQRVALPPAESVVASTFFGCARVVEEAGIRAHCWGSDEWGELGRGGLAPDDAGPRPRREPGPVLWDAAVDDLALPLVEAQLGCLRSGTQVACWGRNLLSALGHVRGMNGDRPCPYGSGDEPCNDRPVALAAPFDSLAFVGYFAGCATRAGETLCWGTNASALLGQGSVDGRAHVGPESASALPPGVASMSARATHACAVTTSGEVHCYGTSSYAECGLADASTPCGDYTCQARPVKIDNLPPIAEVASGLFFTVALARDGTVWAWGRNSHGQLGHLPLTDGDFECPNARDEIDGSRACNPMPRQVMFPE